MSAPVRLQQRVRYGETDPQGVVFNAWYLAYCDEACADFLEAIGADHEALVARGYDVQVVRAELDWRSSLRARETVTIEVGCDHLGTTSFTLRFDLTCDDRPVAVARIVYVGIDTAGPTPVPPALRSRLEQHRSRAVATS